MTDEALIEEVKINLEGLQKIIDLDERELQENGESDNAYRTTIIVEDGISTLEDPGMLVCTPAAHLFLIDAEDWPRISGFKWYVSSDGGTRMYVSTYIGKKKSYLHRMILEPSNGQRVDHCNGDPLDNRKANLRLATHQQNMFNRRKPRTYGRKPTASSHKGVTWDRSRGRYKAQIVKNGINYNLGHFTDEKRAAVTYDHAALEMFGEFAHTNFTYEDCEKGPRPSLGEDPRVDLPYTLAS